MARSTLRKTTKKTSKSRARKNPSAWKFAVGIPVAIGAGYLLYKYVFMNEAQAAELVEGTKQLTGSTPAALPGQLESGVTVPAIPTLPTSGSACYAGTIAGQSCKLSLQFKDKGATGVLVCGGKEMGKIGVSRSGRLTAYTGDPTFKTNFKLRMPFTVTDAIASHQGWTLAKSKC